MANTVRFFPVGNGDMSLIKLGDDFTLLIDCNFKDTTTDNCPVLMTDELFDTLPRDERGRPYVDVFLITHPDQDHCLGAEKYLYLGKPDDYADKPKDGERKKIFVRELWSSPLTFRRLKKLRKDNKEESLCSDGEAIWAEARRRVKAYKKAHDTGTANSNKDLPLGDRICVIGDDLKGDKHDSLKDLKGIHVPREDIITIHDDDCTLILEAHVRAPIMSEGDEDEELLTKNNSSIVMQFRIFSNGSDVANWLLFGGDAGVEVWRRLHDEYGDDLNDKLSYQVLLAPHHCSKSVFIPNGQDKVDEKAREALSQTRGTPRVVASSRPTLDMKDGNPPHRKAKDVYLGIIGQVESRFIRTGSYQNEDEPVPLTFELTTKKGPTILEEHASSGGLAAAGIVSLTRKERPHG